MGAFTTARTLASAVSRPSRMAAIAAQTTKPGACDEFVGLQRTKPLRGQEGGNRYPMYSEYDWFRFYRWDGDHDYPCPSYGTSCLTPDDTYLSSNIPCDGIRQKVTVYG